MAKFDPKAFAKKMKPYYAKVTVADPITGVEMDFENQIKADKWLAQREITKVSSPSKVSFTNPVTGKTETVLDSSAMETKLGHIKSTQVKDLRTRSGVLVDKITEMENQLKSPTFEDKYPLIQANLNTAYDELEKISTELGGSYQRPSGDADIKDGSIFDSKVFPWNWSFGVSTDVSDERQWKADFQNKLNTGEVKQDSSKASWTQNKYVDFMYQKELERRKNQKPLEQQSDEELIKNAGK